jgi:hypothetical protein
LRIIPVPFERVPEHTRVRVSDPRLRPPHYADACAHAIVSQVTGTL